jgi:hypothetical protein
MSAATVFPEIKNSHLQNLCFAVLNAIRTAGTNAQVTGFTDRLGQAVTAQSAESGNVSNPTSQAAPAREVEILIRINPDGLSAVAKVLAQSPAGLQTQIGSLDPTLLAGVTL